MANIDNNFINSIRQNQRESYKKRDGSEKLSREEKVAAREQRKSEREDRRAERRGKKNDQSIPAGETPTPVQTQPPTTTPPAASPPASDTKSRDLQALAERYVDTYNSQAGKNLSDEQKKTLVTEVYNFYSAPSRSGRLDKIVD